MALLRCLTFNIWKNEGDFARRMEAIAALLVAHQPDVVALQECFIAPEIGIDSVLQVAGGRYHVTRYCARAKPRRHAGAWCNSRSDMALLTREKPDTAGRRALPIDLRDGERGLLWADVSAEGRRVRLGCTHFTHLHDVGAQATRHRQALGVVATLQADAQNFILMGDLNAVSDNPALAPIFQNVALCPVARELAAAPGGSVPANGAIDHILPFSTQRTARQVSRRIVCAPDAANFPSDHPAILAEVEIT
jgi:endonuclease/exonuclease/phosphatase family metal-dependent hydrolase